jgi:hypothetical protein
VTLEPKVVNGPIPSWETARVSIQPESDSVRIPVPALASQDEIGCFALTVVFEDNGDGGPVVEWQPAEGDSLLMSAGLGEDGVAIGLNARTLLLPESLTLDGGTLKVSFPGRFSRLISVTLRPAREVAVAALGAGYKPALLAENDPVLTEEEVSGADVTPKAGDSTDGNVIHAELSASPKQLDLPGSDGVMEFIVPMSSSPQGSLLQTEVAGLDPESWIEVRVNGESQGALGTAPFSLNSPGVLFSDSGRLVVAGWHPGSLFLPARLWKQGENSVVLMLRRAAGDAGQAVYLRKARIDLLFSPAGSSAITSTNVAAAGIPALSTPAQASQSAVIPTPAASPLPPSTSDTLSSGSAYGNPSPSLFHGTLPPPLPMETNQTQ